MPTSCKLVGAGAGASPTSYKLVGAKTSLLPLRSTEDERVGKFVETKLLSTISYP